MLELGGKQPAAADDSIKDSGDASFMQDVIEVSKTVPVKRGCLASALNAHVHGKH